MRAVATTLAWMAVTALALSFSNGRFALPVVAWIAPILLLRFVRVRPAIRGLLLAFAVLAVAYAVMWYGMIPVPDRLYLPITTTYAFFYLLAYVVHRLMAPRLGGFLSTLVFPTAWITIEMVLQRWITPYGSWCSIAYTQLDHLPLVQIVSVAGLPGLSFLMVWFASIVEWVWHERGRWRQVGVGSLGYAALLVGVLVFGGLRLAGPSTAAPTVRVAGLTPDPRLEAPLREALAPFFSAEPGGAPSPDELERIERLADAINADLLERSRREVRAGSRIVAWSETAARTTKAGEERLLQAGRRLAVEEGAFLLMAYVAWDPTGSPPLENKAVAIDPAGRLGWTYLKSRPIYGAESPWVAPGDDVLPTIDSRFGRLGVAICHDLDFPELIRPAGRDRVEILFVPAADWSAITPWHAEMAVFRAVENGLALVRPTSGGLAVIADPQGRIVAALDDRSGPAAALVGHVPVRRATTVYASIGDLFPWLAALGFAALIVLAAARPRRGPA